MLECEGYKMFKGILKVFPKSDKIKPFQLEGTFLYKPECDCWYGDGRSFAARICEIIEVK